MTDNTTTAAVAAEIRALMARKRLSQQELASRLGLSQVSVSRRLLGQTPIDVNELAIISDFLGTSPAALLSQRASA